MKPEATLLYAPGARIDLTSAPFSEPCPGGPMSILHRPTFLSPFLIAVCAVLTVTSTAQALDVTKAKIIDLTHAIDANTIFWPTEKKTFQLTEEYKGAGLFLRVLQILLSRARRHAHRCAVSLCQARPDDRRNSNRSPKRPGRRYRRIG